MKELKIRQGWYFGAGSVYKWRDDGFHMHGIGINREYFNDPELQVEVDGKKYLLDTVKGREFVNKYHAFKRMGESWVGFVSRDLLKEV